MIEGTVPGQWGVLERYVRRIFSECEMEARAAETVNLVRGAVEIDVLGFDHSREPKTVVAVECKYWKRRVTQQVVHAFRTVVNDAGIHVGIVVSMAGYQRGALQAAGSTNIRLMNWNEFQAALESRWFNEHMVPTLLAEVDPLIEYTEPVNSRIFRKADALSLARQEEFKRLRDAYWRLAFSLFPWAYHVMSPTKDLEPPGLPLRKNGDPDLPSDIVDASAPRPLMEAYVRHFRAAIAEFDHLFGERA